MAALGDTVKGMGRIKIGLMMLAAVIMCALFLVVALRTSAAALVPLYTGLSLEDSSKIVAELEKTGTPYELAAQRHRDYGALRQSAALAHEYG